MGYINRNLQLALPEFTGKVYLTNSETMQVAILFEGIFPADHSKGIPGATDAKAAAYISQLLAFDATVYYKIPYWRESYRNGLSLLNKACQEIYKKEIIQLSGEEITETLHLLQSQKFGHLPKQFSQNQFFEMICDHCIEGCFADPRWGGNANGIMWKWLGWAQPAQDLRF